MFTDADVAALERAARFPAKRRQDDDGLPITERLTETAAAFLHNRLWGQKPAPSKNIKRLKAVHTAAKALAAALPREHVKSDHHFRSLLTAQAAVAVSTEEVTDLDGGSRRLRVATGDVRDLIAWSAAAINRELTKIQHGRPVPVLDQEGKQIGHIHPARKRHKGDEPMQKLMGNLNGVWIDFWDRIPGTSRSESTGGEANGPYVRFVLAFLKCLEGHLDETDFIADRGLRDALHPKPESIHYYLTATGITRIRYGYLEPDWKPVPPTGSGKSRRVKT